MGSSRFSGLLLSSSILFLLFTIVSLIPAQAIIPSSSPAAVLRYARSTCLGCQAYVIRKVVGIVLYSIYIDPYATVVRKPVRKIVFEKKSVDMSADSNTLQSSAELYCCRQLTPRLCITLRRRRGTQHGAFRGYRVDSLASLHCGHLFD